MIIHEFTEKSFNEYLKNGVVLVDFFATWCGPCKMLSPVLDKILSEMPDVKLLKVDIDKYQDIAREYRIMSVPTLLLYKDGKFINSKLGYMPVDILSDWITESIK